MKKIVLFLIVIAGVYGVVGSALVESGSKSIQSTAVKMQQAGV